MIANGVYLPSPPARCLRPVSYLICVRRCYGLPPRPKPEAEADGVDVWVHPHARVALREVVGTDGPVPCAVPAAMPRHRGAVPGLHTAHWSVRLLAWMLDSTFEIADGPVAAPGLWLPGVCRPGEGEPRVEPTLPVRSARLRSLSLEPLGIHGIAINNNRPGPGRGSLGHFHPSCQGPSVLVRPLGSRAHNSM